MSVKSWHDTPAEIEIDKGLARETKSRKNLSPPPIHSGMHSATRGVGLGAPPSGLPADTSELPTDPQRQHAMKKFPVPKVHPAMSDRPEGSTYDPDSAFKVVGEAILSGSTRLPDSNGGTVMSRNSPPVLTNPSAPGAVSSFQLTHVAGNTRRPNANDLPLVGSFDGTRNQPTDKRQGSPKAVNRHTDSGKFAPGQSTGTYRGKMRHGPGVEEIKDALHTIKPRDVVTQHDGNPSVGTQTLAQVSSRGATDFSAGGK